MSKLIDRVHAAEQSNELEQNEINAKIAEKRNRFLTFTTPQLAKAIMDTQDFFHNGGHTNNFIGDSAIKACAKNGLPESMSEFIAMQCDILWNESQLWARKVLGISDDVDFIAYMED